MQHRKNRQWHILVLAVVLNFFAISSACAFSINITYEIGSNFTTSQQSILTQAGNYWESVITGYKNGYTGISEISVSATTFDGAEYGVVGSAGPNDIIKRNNYWYTTTGSMEYDTYDLALLNDSTLYYVFVHELAHIIGFGTLWELNNLYTDGTGEYHGAAALAAYQSEFNPTATFIPVELGGQPGTANGHWDEVGPPLDDGNNSANPMDPNELMTGWIDSSMYVSNTTKASFIDLGYTVNLAAVPLPAAIWLFCSGLLGLMGWSRRKQIAC